MASCWRGSGRTSDNTFRVMFSGFTSHLHVSSVALGEAGWEGAVEIALITSVTVDCPAIHRAVLQRFSSVRRAVLVTLHLTYATVSLSHATLPQSWRFALFYDSLLC